MSLTLTTLYSDNFNRSNVSPLTGAWSLDWVGSNGLEIVNDLCDGAYVSSPSPSNDGGQVYANTLPNDQFVSATVATDGLVGGVGINVKARVTGMAGQSWGTSGGYRFTVSSGTWYLFSDSGAGVIALGSLTLQVGDVLTVACIGTTIYALHNSTILTSITNTQWSSGASILGINNDGVDATFGVVSLFAVGSAAVASGGGGGSSTIFLGSVVVLASAPAGRANPYVGKFTKITSAPSGVPNPFLGSVVAGSAPAGHSDVSLGEIVEISSPPAGAPNPFLGTFEGT